jgi:hypothetical protein
MVASAVFLIRQNTNRSRPIAAYKHTFIVLSVSILPPTSPPSDHRRSTQTWLHNLALLFICSKKGERLFYRIKKQAVPQCITIGAITDLDYHMDVKNRIQKEQDVDFVTGTQ